MQPPTDQLTSARDVTDSRETLAGGLHQSLVKHPSISKQILAAFESEFTTTEAANMVGVSRYKARSILAGLESSGRVTCVERGKEGRAAIPARWKINPTTGELAAAKVRRETNNLSRQERDALMKKGMDIINGKDA